MSIVLDGSNGIQIPAGSVNNPPIRSSDTDTGIYFPTSNTIAITIDGSQVGLVNANGQTDLDGLSVSGESTLNVATVTTATVTNLSFHSSHFFLRTDSPAKR